MTLLASSSGSNALLSPSPGLMIWTLITFLLSLWVLNRYAFGPIQAALDKRRQTILDSVDQAERARDEAQSLLDDYNSQLAGARGEAEAIVDRARKAGDELTSRIKDEGEKQRAEAIVATQQQVTAEVEKAMGELRTSVAEMTVEASEKVLKGVIDVKGHSQLIEQAVDELDFGRLQKVGSSS